jgi:hypothetical protein
MKSVCAEVQCGATTEAVHPSIPPSVPEHHRRHAPRCALPVLVCADLVVCATFVSARPQLLVIVLYLEQQHPQL